MIIRIDNLITNWMNDNTENKMRNKMKKVIVSLVILFQVSITNSQTSQNDMPVILNKERLELKPSESDTVEALVKTDKNISKGYIHRLQLLVSEPEDKGIKLESRSAVEVIPKVSGQVKRFQEIPAKLKLSFTGQDNGQRKSGGQAEFSAAGKIDEQGEKNIKMLVRAPDIQHKSGIGSPDEYNLEFWTDDYAIYAGDRSYSLSALTESGFYSSGLEAKVKMKDVVMGAYNSAVRQPGQQNEETGAYLDYSLDEKQSVGLNYLNKRYANTDFNFLSVESVLCPSPDNKLKMEYAKEMQSQMQDSAYLLNFSSYQELMSVDVRFLRADPNYPGNYQDHQYFSGDFALPISSKIRLNMGYYETRDNLDLNPEVSSAATVEDYYKLGLSYHLFRPLDLTFNYQQRNRIDVLGVPDFNLQENTLRLGVNSSFGKISLSGAGEWGKGQDNVLNESYQPVRYSLNSSFSPTLKQRYSAYARYNSDGKAQRETNEEIALGAKADYKIAQRTQLDLNFQTNFNRNQLSPGPDNFAVGINHQLRDNNQVSLRAQRTTYRNSDRKAESSYLADYVMALGVPVGLNRKAGAVKGNIYDDITKKMVPGVILRLNDLATLSDKKGSFAFNGLKPSQYCLNINTSAIGLNKITIPKAPFKIDVEGGKDTMIQLRLTEAALISGRILAFNPLDEFRGITIDPDEPRVLKAQGVPNIRVELNSGLEVRHAITDERGYFEFQEVYPGRSIVTVSVAGMPQYYCLLEDRSEVELNPAGQKEMMFKFLPQERSIKIIESDAVIEEERA